MDFISYEAPHAISRSAAACVVTLSEPRKFSRQLFIVSRETPYIAEYMREQFGEEPNVTVLVDRREGRDRRATARPVEVERRGTADRRQRTAVDRQVKESFHALVTIA